MIYNVSRTHEVHIIFYLFPLPFPSWEGLGVGFSYLLPAPCSLLPKNQKFVPHKS
ncbi:hypothetical protein [Moorena producens]|uniref:hypothetical protein n=1 Tax=Moorena producens TaxID=1155739 RepID=UPI001314B49B|nr:hypothetical protein [Moorena producens]